MVERFFSRGKIPIATDSASDLGQEYAQEHNVNTVVPLTVIFGEHEYQCGVDIDSDMFYEMLEKSKVFPTSSAPSPEAFKQAFEEALETNRTKKLVYLGLTRGVKEEELSATFRFAKNAAEELCQENPKLQIVTIDTGQASMGEGILARRAGLLSEQGKSVEEIQEEIFEMMTRTFTFGTLQTLEFLRRGGRLGFVKGLPSVFSPFFNTVKPSFRIHQGEITTYKKIRTKKGAFGDFLNLVDNLPDKYGLIEEIAIVEGYAPYEAGIITEHVNTLKAKGLVKKSLETFKLGPVLGVYGGKGVYGVCVLFARK